MSVKVFMPLLNYQLFIFFRKFFGLGQFAELETVRLAQFYLVFHFKHRFAAAVADVDVNRAMVVAIKEKPEPVFFKNGWHGVVKISDRKSVVKGKSVDLGGR